MFSTSGCFVNYSTGDCLAPNGTLIHTELWDGSYGTKFYRNRTLREDCEETIRYVTASNITNTVIRYISVSQQQSDIQGARIFGRTSMYVYR